ncbi:MAG: aconitase X catalytic domain-containing protein [Thermoproteota archaeon]|jgi:predicted aconitase|nr:aconitase X catalytic domain-containing protein [Thermoproteota archaeon]
MELAKDEEEALDSKHGDALASAYRVLVAIGEATDAKKLIPIKWAHISGVNYNTIGDAGLRFLEKFSSTAKVTVMTTINPMGYDTTKLDDIPTSFQEKQANIVRSYERMGAVPSFTCTPYELFDVPQRGTSVSFAESNAAVYSNSLLGLMTNKESALSALASSITGKAPLSDLRLEETRSPKVAIEADFDLRNELDYGLLGYFAGMSVKDSSVAFDIRNRLDTVQAKALCSAIGTSGSCGMFTFGGRTAEKVSFGKKDAQSILDDLSTVDDGNIITLGSPQLGMNELGLLVKLTKSRKFTKRCMVFCSKAIHNQGIKMGLVGKLEKSGVEFMCNSCTCLTPYISKDKYDAVITNSVKGAYYLTKSNKVKVALKDMRTIVEEYTQ